MNNVSHQIRGCMEGGSKAKKTVKDVWVRGAGTATSKHKCGSFCGGCDDRIIAHIKGKGETGTNTGGRSRGFTKEKG